MYTRVLTGLFWFANAVTAVALPPELQIETTSGPVQGIYNDTSSTVRAFLGIPYAEPPTGNHRFAPPRPKSPSPGDSSSHPINASAFSGPCPQAYQPSNQSIWSILPYEIYNPAQMSEDCLSVNVWAPAVQRLGKERGVNDGKAAVMVFIHGGAFTEGAGSVGFYDGSNLVREQEGVIVVTFKYFSDLYFPLIYPWKGREG